MRDLYSRLITVTLATPAGDKRLARQFCSTFQSTIYEFCSTPNGNGKKISNALSQDLDFPFLKKAPMLRTTRSQRIHAFLLKYLCLFHIIHFFLFTQLVAQTLPADLSAELCVSHFGISLSSVWIFLYLWSYTIHFIWILQIHELHMPCTRHHR